VSLFNELTFARGAYSARVVNLTRKYGIIFAKFK